MLLKTTVDPAVSFTCSTPSVLQRRADASHGDDGKRPEKILMESLQRGNEILDPGHAVPFATQPADEFEAQLRGEAAQVAEAYLLQEVAGVAPQHHVDVHVLCALHVPTDGNERGEER